MINFTTRKVFLYDYYTSDVKEEEKIFKFLELLEKSGVSKFIKERDEITLRKGGRPAYNECNLFATILYGFAFNRCTLRDLEEGCKFDLRYMYIMERETPSFMTFDNFINEIILPNRDEIFHTITKTIIEEIGIDINEAFIDGTKFEADANKYKFVWKPTTYHNKLSDKIRDLLNDLDLNKNVPKEGIIKSELIAKKITQLSKKVKKDSTLNKKYELLNEFLNKSLEYEEKERICGPDRNSYYKTDPDATAMCLKSDYYSGLGSNMHAAYNNQIVVSKGFICTYYASQSRNDIKDFIPTFKKYYKHYNKYPEYICADSGYGSLENYQFLKDNNIKNYVKYQNFSGDVQGDRPTRYHLNDDGTVSCLNGLIGKKVELKERHSKIKNPSFYKIEGCNDCLFKEYCKSHQKNKDEDFKIFEINEAFIKYKQEALNNLLSPKGIELRVNRSSQVENAYGVIKQDIGYTRLRRITMKRVETEIMLTFLGYNIRKYFKFLNGNLKTEYWKAPEDLKEETCRKLSAKKLTRKYKKK